MRMPKNPRPFAGPACRVVGRDGEAKLLLSSPCRGEFQGETSAAREGAAAQTRRPRRGGAAPSASMSPTDRRGTARHMASLPAVDEYIGPLRAVGQRQVGRAAWYGNQHIGRSTSTGEPLDTVHATAAHRSLPLHSLVRVTNLQNGRSVVVRINDRGPVSRSLLIDMSPRAAAAIDMINAGIAEVMIEPVASAGAVGASTATLIAFGHAHVAFDPRRNRRFHRLSPFCNCGRKSTAGVKSRSGARVELTANARSIVQFDLRSACRLYRSGKQKVLANKSCFSVRSTAARGAELDARPVLPRARRMGTTPA